MIEPPSKAAYESLTEQEKNFLYSLPNRVELHAHLNGSIPIETLESLAQSSKESSEGIEVFKNGISLDEIADFFDLFPAIYSLTSTRETVTLCLILIFSKVTVDVLRSFLHDQNATKIELRSTPRATPHMTRYQYIQAVVDGIEIVEKTLGENRIGLIVSVDRRMSAEDANEVVTLASQFDRVVGIDLCGDMFKARDLKALIGPLLRGKKLGKGLTMHLYETEPRNEEEEELEWQLLQLKPLRLGHATYLSSRALEFVKKEGICIELCLSSNVMCKTANSVGEHHITRLLEEGINVTICTDDPLPFRTGLMKELAILLAQPPLGLGLSKDSVRSIADNGEKFMFINN
ncbi:Metallo-dependent hydrolase [Wallemia mellicola]|nr:Metallo-dependent hydrolase [Wallemia mellicola]